MTASRSAEVHRFGSGPRPALALHCTFGHGQAWRGVGEALGDGFTLIAPDLLSHGQAADWGGNESYLQACSDAVAPLAEAPVDLIGHSFGAVIALHLAVQKKLPIRSLCLIEPVLFAAAREAAPACLAELQSVTETYAQALETGDRQSAAQGFTAIWGDGRPWAEVPERTRRYIVDRMHLISAQQGILYDDEAGLLAGDRLEHLSVPVLLLRGARSPGVIEAIQRSLAKRLPDVRAAVIPGAGHMAPVTDPGEVARAIAGFFRSG